jgi:hypothetical protein
MLTGIILSTAGGGLNIIVGSVDPLAFVFAQIGLGVVVLTSTAIITISKQLKLDELVIKDKEYSAPFRHIEEEYRVSASPLTLPFAGGVGGTALHPSPKGALSGARGASYCAFSCLLPPLNRTLRSP